MAQKRGVAERAKAKAKAKKLIESDEEDDVVNDSPPPSQSKSPSEHNSSPSHCPTPPPAPDHGFTIGIDAVDASDLPQYLLDIVKGTTTAPPKSAPPKSAPPKPAPTTITSNDDVMADGYSNSQIKNLRACMVCSILRTQDEFRRQGCPNCDAFLELQGNPDAIQDCTSQVWSSMLTVADTTKSWVARSQRLEGYVPGLYALQVEGNLPEEYIAAAENHGVTYIPRDGSVNESMANEG